LLKGFQVLLSETLLVSKTIFNLQYNIYKNIGVNIVEKSPEKIIVSLETVVSKEISINKKVEGSAAEGLVAGNIDLAPAKTTIRGPKSIVNNITEATVLIKLNGESEKFTKNMAVVALDDQGEFVSNIEFDPAEVSATVPIVKASNNKTVGVRVKTTGVPKTGYFVSNISVTPSTVDITGASSLLTDVAYIETAAVDLTNQSIDIEKDVTLNVKNGLALQIGSPLKVHLKIAFSQNVVSKELTATIVPPNLNGYQVSAIAPNEIKVLCSGPANIISALKSSDVVLNLDFSDKRLSDSIINFNILPTSFKTPEGVDVISVVPSSINVTITKK